MKYEFYSLDVRPEVLHLPATEAEDFLYEIEGKILFSESVDDEDDGEKIGRFQLYFIDFERAMAAGVRPLVVLDQHDSTYEYASVVLDEHGYPFSRRLSTLLNGSFCDRTLLIMERLEILPAYRGKGLGLNVLARLLERYALGDGVVALKPFPLQREIRPHGDLEAEWWDRMGEGDTRQDKEAGRRKLRAYYRRLGFKPMRGTEFMFRPAAAPLVNPGGWMRR